MPTSNVSGMWTGGRTSISVTASPFTFTNIENCPVIVFIAVGTVTAIDFTRDGVVFDSCGLVAGQVSLNPNDKVRVTYTIAPTMVYYPR